MTNNTMDVEAAQESVPVPVPTPSSDSIRPSGNNDEMEIDLAEAHETRVVDKSNVPLEEDAAPDVSVSPTTTTTATRNRSECEKEQTNVKSTDYHSSDQVIEEILYRATAGLPKRELRSIIQETKECEATLLREIQILEDTLFKLQSSGNTLQKNDSKTNDQAIGADPSMPNNSVDQKSREKQEQDEILDAIIESSSSAPLITPLDRYYTASALLGRLRNEMSIPTISTLQNQPPQQTEAEQKLQFMQPLSTTTIDEAKAFDELISKHGSLHNIYTNEIVSQEILLSIWKKISNNRVSFVFKRAVKVEEAPGYTDRILYPMDLSLIRKRIITNNIQTYMDLHNALALISHNCVKYNGRETDYGRVARDFEAFVDHIILQAARQHATSSTTTLTTTTATTVAGDAGVVQASKSSVTTETLTADAKRG